MCDQHTVVNTRCIVIDRLLRISHSRALTAAARARVPLFTRRRPIRRSR
jgi:hypothetical protein